jgi:hypothetical protein
MQGKVKKEKVKKEREEMMTTELVRLLKLAQQKLFIDLMISTLNIVKLG